MASREMRMGVSRRRVVAVVPAAGAGVRFGGGVPKQYRLLAGEAVVARTLTRLRAVGWLEQIFVVVAADDPFWRAAMGGGDRRVQVVRLGGKSRAESVHAGVRVAHAEGFGVDDWVLVHDAVRPCVTAAAIEHLRGVVGDDPVGGILALPVSDTVKLAREGEGEGIRVERTVSRERLWLAQTPQLFRLGVLMEALARTHEPTDEAEAVEALGLRPMLVRGEITNVKVTLPGDLALAEAIWHWQERVCERRGDTAVAGGNRV
ncbi:MAG: 2-C-methyl-D-erythritol 4-phosphate cytidylyltransferase [Hydrogenophilus sp.]|nr:2-C-methyl-D-erythritol 4-phosphate cytidylyltransferase [Hydrogenophilus sp.]